VEGHQLSHDGYPNSYKHRTNLEFAHAAQFSALLDRLKAAASPFGGSLFDHAVVAWSSCLSGNGGGGHSKMKIPFVLAAGSKTGFAMGRHVNAGGRSHTMIRLSLCQAFGLPLQTFGMTRFCPGPMLGLNAPGALPPFTRPQLRVCH
jgi:hypothetical protein